MARYAAPTGNLSTTSDLFIQINSWTDSYFFPAIVFSLFFIMWIRLSFTQPVNRAFAVSSFIGMIFTILLRLANVINTQIMVTFIIFTGIGIVWAYYENTRGSG